MLSTNIFLKNKSILKNCFRFEINITGWDAPRWKTAFKLASTLINFSNIKTCFAYCYINVSDFFGLLAFNVLYYLTIKNFYLY